MASCTIPLLPRRRTIEDERATSSPKHREDCNETANDLAEVCFAYSTPHTYNLSIFSGAHSATRDACGYQEELGQLLGNLMHKICEEHSLSIRFFGKQVCKQVSSNAPTGNVKY